MESSKAIPAELEVEKKGRIAVVTFDAPNLRRPFLEALWQTMSGLENDREIGAIIFTGRRNVFMTGADLKEILALTDATAAARFLGLPHRLVTMFCHSNKVLIAAINGYCLGGGLEFALACDLRIAVDQLRDTDGRSLAYIGFPETKLGLIPAVGGAYLASEIIGIGRAKELFLGAEPVMAEYALQIGLVNAIVARERLLDEAEQFAGRILVNSFPAMKLVKRLLRPRLSGSRLKCALRETAAAFAECCACGDKAERIVRASEERRSRFRNLVQGEHV